MDAATPANGFPLIAGAAVDVDTTAAVHGDAVSGTQLIHYIETYAA